MKQRTSGAVIVAAVLGWLLSCAPGAHAATFVINSQADSHDIAPGDGICGDSSDPDFSRCTLRAAIEESGALAGPDTILISGDTVAVNLTLGRLVIAGGGTSLIGLDGFPAVDGVGNPANSDIFVINSDSNIVRGLTIRRSRRHGVVVYGAENMVGGTDSADGNIFVGNGADDTGNFAIVIQGSLAAENVVAGNLIGVFGNGTEVYANRNGVLITDSAHGNMIGGASDAWRNIISGNTGCGVVLGGFAFENTVAGNFIGPDVTGLSGIGNGAAGVLIEGGAHENVIGGDSAGAGNVISANAGDAVWIRQAFTESNRVAGNKLGTDATGMYSLANLGNGVTISDGARDNLIGGYSAGAQNNISGNMHEGVQIRGTGTDFNIVAGNSIGAGAHGGGLAGGAALNDNGVVISDGARDNVVGGTEASARNLISDNWYTGVLIRDAGTTGNRVLGNFIGVSIYGISSVPNGSGVVIRGGASENFIGGLLVGEGNIISGNRADVFPFGGGVLIYDTGTDHNVVQGNRIGTDTSGTRALRNGSAGVIIGNGARYNVIGGSDPGAGNLISGNGYGPAVTNLARGVHIYGEGTDFNRVSGNVIGLSEAVSAPLPNAGHGVGIFEGARFNTIGGETVAEGNVIAGNDGEGLCIGDAETMNNQVRFNNFFENDSGAVAIRDGAQDGILPPTLTYASTSLVRGLGGPPGGVVDIYLTFSQSDSSFDGTRWVASTAAYPPGGFSAMISGLSIGDSLAAIGTDVDGNSSAFSAGIRLSIQSDVDDGDQQLPLVFSLNQNYPNPFNPSTSITYSLPRSGMVRLTVLNITGQGVATLVDSRMSAGEHTVFWDGTSKEGNPVASGVYFYRLQADTQTACRKMLLLK